MNWPSYCCRWPAIPRDQPRARSASRHTRMRRECARRSNPRQLTDILLRMPGLRLERNPCFMMDTSSGPCRNPNFLGADPRRYVFRPRGGPISFGNAGDGREACGLLIYVDGRYVGDGFRTDLDLEIGRAS